MKKILFPLLALFVLVGYSCKDDEAPEATQTNFSIKYTPRYDGEAISFSDNYTFDGKKIRFNLFTMFLSDLELIKENGEVVALSEIDYFDFTDANINDNFVINRTYADIDMETYKSIRFGVGVKESLNATKPADYTPMEPLGNAGPYWPGWDSYIFLRIQGDYDSANDDSFATDITYHVGSDPTYRTVTIETPITVDENGDLALVFDIHDLLMMNGQPYDIVTNNETPHGPGNIILATELMDNVSNAFSVED